MLVKEIGELTPQLVSNYEEKSKRNSVKVSSPTLLPKKESVEMFHGFEVPQEPKEPESDGVSDFKWRFFNSDTFFTLECCMSGCAVCVYDLYEESMDAYLDAVLAFRSSLTSLKIPKSEWPLSIQRVQSSSLPPPTGSDRQRKGVVMSAFEDLERALEAKQQDVTTHAKARVDSVGR
jgi:hypothetical protein